MTAMSTPPTAMEITAHTYTGIPEEVAPSSGVEPSVGNTSLAVIYVQYSFFLSASGYKP